jgi:peptidoglycan/LPS O-acetylase OafA/YrhL
MSQSPADPGARPRYRTISDKIEEKDAPTSGFDYLRLFLSLFILVWHSIYISGAHFDHWIWLSLWRPFPASLVPMFFALSGFLVAASLGRNPIHRFVTLRIVRIFPALTVEVALSALLLGLLFTSATPLHYLASPKMHAYFLNIIGIVHTNLPGVFAGNPHPGEINNQLWTIPFEFECYLALVIVAIVGLAARPHLFAVLVALAVVLITAKALLLTHHDPKAHEPGRLLVVTFLFGVIFYLWRAKIPYNAVLGGLSVVASVVLLESADLSYLAAAPLAYATLWIGLMRLPAIPFGDLSYGIYLFHFPIEQLVTHYLPAAAHSWWLISLISIPLVGFCAFLSWTFVERPILLRKALFLAGADWVQARCADALGRLGLPRWRGLPPADRFS